MTNTTKYVELIGPGGKCKVPAGEETRYLSQDGWKLAKKKVDGKPQAELAPVTEPDPGLDDDGPEDGADDGGGDGGAGDLTKGDIQQMTNKQLAKTVEDYGLDVDLSGNNKAKQAAVVKALGLE